MPFSSDDRRIQIRRVRKNGKHTVSGMARRRVADESGLCAFDSKTILLCPYAFGRLYRQSERPQSVPLCGCFAVPGEVYTLFTPQYTAVYRWVIE